MTYIDQYWNGPYARVYSVDTLGGKGVTDNGRPVSEIFLLDASGVFEADGYGSGSAVSSLSNRDNYPLIEKGNILYAFCKNYELGLGLESTVALFIVEKIDIAEKEDKVTYSGSGLSKELARKVLNIPYIAENYEGTAPDVAAGYVELDAAHSEADDYYNGGIIQLDGKLGVIEDYTNSTNRVTISEWTPSDPSGTDIDYTIFHGNADDDIDQAIYNASTGWTSDESGTPSGTFHEVGGRHVIDLIKDIQEQSGDNWHWYTRMDAPERVLYWFDANAAPVDSGIDLRKHTEWTNAQLLADQNKGIVFDCSRTRDFSGKYSRAYISTNEGITLNGLTAGDVTAKAGYSVDFSNSLVKNDTAEATLTPYEIVEKTHVFNNIKAASDTPEAIKEAQIKLYNAGYTLLDKGDHTVSSFIIETVLFRDLTPGESLHIEYEKLVPGSSEVLWNVDNDLWIRKIQTKASHTDGVRYLTIEVGQEYTSPIIDGETALADFLKQSQQGFSAGLTIITGPGGGGTGVSYHGDLTGLLLDHHTQYALLSGRAGNILNIDQIRAFTSSGLLLTENGDQGIFIEDTTGNVHIGGISPAGRLHINGTEDDEQLIVEAHSTQTVDVAQFRTSGGTAMAGVDKDYDIYARVFRARDSTGLKLYEDGGIGIDIEDSSGFVGINEPDPDRQLHVTDNGSIVAVFEQTATGNAVASVEWRSNSGAWRINKGDSADPNIPDGFGIYDADSTAYRLAIAAGGNISIGSTAEEAKLFVNGTADDEVLVIKAYSSQTANIMEWRDSSGNVLGGIDERGVPFADINTDFRNLFIGDSAGTPSSAGIQNVGIGYAPLTNLTSGNGNFGLGAVSLQRVSNESNNTAIGTGSLRYLTGRSNVGLGSYTLYGEDGQPGGHYNVAIGYQAGYNHISGNSNIFIGLTSGFENETGANNIFLGIDSGRNETGSNKLYIEPSSSAFPLIYGEFDNDLIEINGELFVDGDLTFVGPQTIYTDLGDLTISPYEDLHVIPDGDIFLAPGGDNVYINDYTSISSQSWVSGFLGDGWGMTTGLAPIVGGGTKEYDGHLDARSAYFDELRVTLFSADETLVLAGSHMVSPGMAKISRDFTLPSAIDGTSTIWFRDSDALQDTPIFKNDSWIMIRTKSTDASGLTVALVWGVISNYTDGTGGDDGEQSWTYTLKSLGAVWDIPGAPEAATSQVIDAESVAIGFGVSGDGWVMTTVNDLTSGPYMSINTWTGTAPFLSANRSQHVRLGGLNGIAGIGQQYGLYAGISPSGPRIIVSDTQAAIHQMPLTLYSGTNDGAYIRLGAFRLDSDVESNILPNTDIYDENIEGVSGSGSFHDYIDDDPESPGTDYLRNVPGENATFECDLTDISHTLTELTFQAVITPTTPVDDVCILTAQIKSYLDGSALTDEIKLATLETAPGLIEGSFTGIDTTASDGDWGNAYLVLKWIYHVGGGDPVIKLEPSMEIGPYIAVGDPIPQAFDVGTGFWVGNDGGTYKWRVGKPDEQGIQWNGTELLLTNFEGESIIDLDASGVSIALGSPAPTDYLVGDGIWMGLNGGYYKFRAGIIGAQGIFWTGQDLELRNNDGDAVITLDSSGNSYFEGKMTIGTNGGIWQAADGTFAAPENGFKIYNDSDIGTFSFYNVFGAEYMRFNDAGIGFDSGFAYGPSAGSTLTWWQDSIDGSYIAAAVGGEFDDTPNHNNLYLNTYLYNSSTLGANIFLNSAAGVSVLEATADTIEIEAEDDFYILAENEILISSNSDVVTISPALQVSNGLGVGHGIYVGDATEYDFPSNGVIVLDQGNGDYTIMECRSSDVSSMTSQGMATDETFFQIGKNLAASGAAEVRGAGTSERGLVLIGSANTAVSTRAAGANAPVEIRGFVDNAKPANGDNAVAISSGNTKGWFMTGNTTIYLNTTITQNNFDKEDDISLARRLQIEMGPKGIIQSKWDEFVDYHRHDLERLDILTAEGFLNEQNFFKLITGAIWQSDIKRREDKSKMEKVIDSLLARINKLENILNLA